MALASEYSSPKLRPGTAGGVFVATATLRPSDQGGEPDVLVGIGAGYSVEFAARHSFGPTVSLDFVREQGSWARAFGWGATLGVRV